MILAIFIVLVCAVLAVMGGFGMVIGGQFIAEAYHEPDWTIGRSGGYFIGLFLGLCGLLLAAFGLFAIAYVWNL